MNTQDRLRSAFGSLGAPPHPTEQAWESVTRLASRSARGRLLRRIAVIVGPLLGLTGLGLGVTGALAPAGHSSRVVVEPAPQSASAGFSTVNWARTVVAPGALDCNAGYTGPLPFTAAVDNVGYVRLGSRAVAVVLAHCDANGHPPSGLFVYDHPSGASAHLARVLLSPSKRDVSYRQPLRVTARSVSLEVGTYNSAISTPCCPDRYVVLRWSAQGSNYGPAQTVRVLPDAIVVKASMAPQKATVGSNVTIRLSITNRSGSTLDSFFLTDDLPTQLQWVSGPDGCLAPRSLGPSCGITALPVGKTVNVAVVEKVLRSPVPILHVSVRANTAAGSRDPYSGQVTSAGVTVTTVVRVSGT